MQKTPALIFWADGVTGNPIARQSSEGTIQRGFVSLPRGSMVMPPDLHKVCRLRPARGVAFVAVPLFEREGP
eukprot:1415461-Pyramimonas_sp.AAC.1